MNMNKTQVLLASVAVLATFTIAQPSTHAAKYASINWMENSDLTTVDPSKATDAPSFHELDLTQEALYREGKKGNPELAAAKSAKVSKDGLTWTFKLRHNLKWANGEKLTAKDFVYGWQRTINPKTAAEYAYLYSGIKNADSIQAGKVKDVSKLGITAVGDYELKVTLENPMPQLPMILMAPGFAPQNQAFVEKAGSHYGTNTKYALSSGPFILKGWNGSNTKYTLVKNKNYWDKRHVKTPKFNVQVIKDYNTGYNLFKAGKLDYAPLSPAQINATKNNPNLKKLAGARGQWLELNRSKVKAFKNKKIRLAITHAINRKNLVNKVLTGSAVAAKTYTPLRLSIDPNTGKDFAKSNVTGNIKYNAKLAKTEWQQGLKEVGIKTLKLTILGDDTDDAKNVAQFIQAQLQDTLPGLTIDVKSVPKQTRSDLQTKGDFDIALTGWGADFNDPINFLQLKITGSDFNTGKWSNKTFDKYIKLSNTTDVTNPKQRFKDLGKAERIIQEDVGVVPLDNAAATVLWRQSVKGAIIASNGNELKEAYKLAK